MSHSLLCDKCQSRLKLKPGKTTFRGRCPKCGGPIEWTAKTESVGPDAVESLEVEEFEYRPLKSLPPLASQTTETTRRDRSREVLRKLLAGFEGTIPRRGPGFGYRITLLLTAVAVALLAVLYVAIIVATGYGVYWYATTILPSGLQMRGRLMAFVMVFHGSVVLAGAATIWSLVAPVLFYRDDEDADVGLSVGEAPLLHSFVGRIADALGAPVPAEIHLSCDVNASAGYRGGLPGLFSKRLVLTIGAPLIAGLNTQQLAGIIAHELGHFSQRGGLTMGHLIRKFTVWCAIAGGIQQSFARGVSDGEPADSAGEVIFRLVFQVIQSIAGAIIWCLAMIGLFITMFVSRRQEFDADRYEAQLSGSDAFFGTVRRLIELSMGQAEVMKRGRSYVMRLLLQPGGIGELAAEVVAGADAKAHQAVRQIEKELQTPTGWFDSHPGHRERIAAVRANPEPGIFQLTLPAWQLCPKLNPNPVAP